MADDIDLANEMMDREILSALSKMRQSSGNGKEGAEYCVECDDKMPTERRKLGFSICVSCAEESERKKSQFA